MHIGKTFKNSILTGFALFFIAGCTTQPGNSASNTTSTLPTDIPSDCVTSNLVTIVSKEAGTVNPEVNNSYFNNWRPDSAQLIFANYAVDPVDIYSNITAGRVLTVINITHVDGTQITSGIFYKADTVNGQAVNKKVEEFNISTSALAGGVFDNNGKVDIKFMNNKYVCGSITSDDGSSSIKGNFIAKFLVH